MRAAMLGLGFALMACSDALPPVPAPPGAEPADYRELLGQGDRLGFVETGFAGRLYTDASFFPQAGASPVPAGRFDVRAYRMPQASTALDLEKHVTASLGTGWNLDWSNAWRRGQSWTGVWQHGDKTAGALFVDGTNEEFDRRGRNGFPEQKYAVIYLPL